MNRLILFFIAITIISCSSDGNEEQTNTNTLTIKHINDGVYDYYFNTEGRLDSVTNSESQNFGPNDLLHVYSYSNTGLLTNHTWIVGTEILDTEIGYTGTMISNYQYQTLGSNSNSPVNQSNNVLTFIDEDIEGITEDDQEVSLTFASSDLMQLLEYKKVYVNQPQQPLFYKYNNTYDVNGNILTKTSQFGNTNAGPSTKTYSYDDKKNPIAQSMDAYRTVYSILPNNEDPNVQLSPNNVLSVTLNDGTTINYSYEYNSDDYPISATKINADTNEVINTLTYTYYEQ